METPRISERKWVGRNGGEAGAGGRRGRTSHADINKVLGSVRKSKWKAEKRTRIKNQNEPMTQVLMRRR